MSSVMFWRALYDLRWTVFWYTLGLVLYGVVIISVYPMFREMMVDFEALIAQYPEAVLRAFGLEGDFSGLAAFIGVEFINVIWPIIVAIFIIMAGTATVAREIERGTADLWLSVPEARWRLLTAKIMALCIGIAILVAGTMITLGVGAVLIDDPFGLGALIAASVVLLSFPFAVLGYSVLLSSMYSERGIAAGIAAGITILSYLSWLIAGLTERWEWLRFVSIFTAYKPQVALEMGQLPWAETLILLSVGIATLTAAIIVFQRRDVSTV